MRIAVVGAGGVGGYFGGRLAQAGASVAFIARGGHLEAIRRDGLHVESLAGDFALRPVEVTDDPGSVGRVDLVLVCVKAWQVPEVAPSLRPLLGASTAVIPLQNGVEAAPQLAAVIGGERVLGGLCRIVSYVAGPGRIRHAGASPHIEFGELQGGRSERVAGLRALFERASGLSVETPDDITAALWKKFLFIAPLSGVGAVTRAPIGVLRGIPETRAMLEAAMREVLDLARARGIGMDADVVARTMSYVDTMPSDATASMQRDILEGRPSELEYQTGTIVRFGREARVPVPVNECLYRSLLPAELKVRGLLTPQSSDRSSS
ncbi:MAG: 2-dehydropantoate 2-reductase [Vicinamibacteria bacterium]